MFQEEKKRKKPSVVARLTGINKMEVVHDLDRVILNGEGQDFMQESAGQKVESKQEGESRWESQWWESQCRQETEGQQKRKEQTSPKEGLKDLHAVHAGIPSGDVYATESFISIAAASEKSK